MRYETLKSLARRTSIGLAVVGGSVVAMATDPTADDVVSSATTIFGSVAVLAIAITTFFVGIRLVKKFAK
jgi:hypothetical protein